tara:strand:+ start:455 stop:616 length:162 start_codon:yes stop_codon:yes gene_type:complete
MGYDVKAVKISTELKVMAASFPTKAQGKAFIKRFVAIKEGEYNNYQSKKRSGK